MDAFFFLLLGFMAGIFVTNNASMRTCLGCRKLLDGELPDGDDDHA
ncbi:hypothetical protein [Fodinicola acaciae]|nr:hypothetical protein [Fodinicola acaciae]